MIAIYGTLVWDDDISRCFFFHFFKTLVFWVVSELKGQKMSQTDKIIMSVVLYILGTIHHMIVIYGTQV